MLCNIDSRSIGKLSFTTFKKKILERQVPLPWTFRNMTDVNNTAMAPFLGRRWNYLCPWNKSNTTTHHNTLCGRFWNKLCPARYQILPICVFYCSQLWKATNQEESPQQNSMQAKFFSAFSQEPSGLNWCGQRIISNGQRNAFVVAFCGLRSFRY